MDLFDIARMLWRRWYVVLPIGAVTLAVALLVHVTTPPEYEAVGFLQLQTPELDRADDPSSATIDPVELSQTIGLEGGASFSVSPLDGQYFTIRAADQTAEGAETAVDQVIADLTAQITALQQDEQIPAAERMELRMAIPDVAVEAQDDATFVGTARMFLYNATAAAPENPYRPDASTGRLLQVAAMGDAGQQRFDEIAGEEVEFEVGQDTRDAAALLEVLTTGPDPVAVVDAFYDVQTLLAEDLAARQARADVADSRRITIEVLDAPLDATDVSPPVSRAVVAIIGLGGLLALGAVVGIESLDNMRSRVRREEPEDWDVAPGGDGHGEDAAPGPGPAVDESEGDEAEPGRPEPEVEVRADAMATKEADRGAEGTGRTDEATGPVDEAAGPADEGAGPADEGAGSTGEGHARQGLNGRPVEPGSTEPVRDATDGRSVAGPTDGAHQTLELVEINEALAATTRERDDE